MCLGAYLMYQQLLFLIVTDILSKLLIKGVFPRKYENNLFLYYRFHYLYLGFFFHTVEGGIG